MEVHTHSQKYPAKRHFQIYQNKFNLEEAGLSQYYFDHQFRSKL